MAYQYVGTNTRPILHDDPYKRNQKGILDAQVGWETMQLMPYGARMDAYKQHPNMSMQQIAQMRAQQALQQNQPQQQQQMQPNNSGVPPLLARPYTAADVPSLGTGGPLTTAAMDSSSGISQRPALSANNQPNYVMQQQPVLSIGGQNVTQPFASEQAILEEAEKELNKPQTGQRRDNTNTGQAIVTKDENGQPVQKQGFFKRMGDMLAKGAYSQNGEIPLSQRLIRMGGAMQGSSHLGGNAAMAAMAEQQAMMQQEDQAQRNTEADRQISALSTYQDAIQEQQTLLGDLDMQDRKLADAYDKFNQFGNNVTGVYDSTVMSGWDNLPFGDPKREAFRTELKAIMVDETLLRTANTKGAISDKEMALFQSAVPSMNQSEEVWKAWIEARRENIAVIRNRLRNGITVSRDADVGFKNTYKAPVESAVQQQGSGTAASAFSDDELSEIENNL